ncbi:hypothetical protein V2G26_013102 [Clonostachys chloroleuca]
MAFELSSIIATSSRAISSLSAATMSTQTTTTTITVPTGGQETGSQLKFETSIDYSQDAYKYSHYLPHYHPGLQPPLEEFEHVDVGLRADPAKTALLTAPGSSFDIITPAIGTEVHGLQLSALDSKQRDELALLVAERGVVVFRGQDFADIGFDKQNHPELLPVYRDFKAGAVDNEIKNNVSSIKWHTDMSYEINGMGTTTFLALDTPKAGGDTLYLSTVAAYNALSPLYREKLHGLEATHSGFDQARVADHKERYIREPIETVHPVVRTHPVTKSKSLYVNRLYTRRIQGLKEEESANILNFLYNHIEHGQDWHIRVHWTPGTVVVYDNRITQHSALRDFQVREGQTRRHMLRITPQAERPFFDPKV